MSGLIDAQREDDPDILKILLASDTHLGYMERDPVRGSDSLRTFEEILQLAHQNQVRTCALGPHTHGRSI